MYFLLSYYISILKSTNSGRKEIWNTNLEQLSENIYNTINNFPNKLWKLYVYYEIPYTQYGKTNSYRNKLIFDKDSKNIEDISRLIILTFTNEITINAFEIGDNHCIEDIDLEKIEIKIEH